MQRGPAWRFMRKMPDTAGAHLMSNAIRAALLISAVSGEGVNDLVTRASANWLFF